MGEDHYTGSNMASVTSPELVTIKHRLESISDQTNKLETRMGKVETAMESIPGMRIELATTNGKIENTNSLIKGILIAIGVFMPLITALTMAILGFVLNNMWKG